VILSIVGGEKKPLMDRFKKIYNTKKVKKGKKKNDVIQCSIGL